MIKQKLEKIEKQINEIKKMNKRFISILHFVNDNVFCYEGNEYNTIEKLKRENSINDFDNLTIIPIKFL